VTQLVDGQHGVSQQQGASWYEGGCMEVEVVVERLRTCLLVPVSEVRGQDSNGASQSVMWKEHSQGLGSVNGAINATHPSQRCLRTAEDTDLTQHTARVR
jgi:hypothetical protein